MHDLPPFLSFFYIFTAKKLAFSTSQIQDTYSTLSEARAAMHAGGTEPWHLQSATKNQTGRYSLCTPWVTLLQTVCVVERGVCGTVLCHCFEEIETVLAVPCALSLQRKADLSGILGVITVSPLPKHGSYASACLSL